MKKQKADTVSLPTTMAYIVHIPAAEYLFMTQLNVLR